MKYLPDIHLRTSIVLLLAGTLLATLLIVGSGIFAVMVERISAENQIHVRKTATAMADRIETFLGDVEARVLLAGTVYESLPVEKHDMILKNALLPNLDAIYSIDANGKLAAVSVANISEARRKELIGIDLSAYRIFFGAPSDRQAVHWSDKHTSAVTGVVTVGLAVPIEGGNGTIIAELALETLLKISNIAAESGSLEYWIIDSKGEVVADTNPTKFGKTNLYSLPVVSAGLAGNPLPQTMMHGDTLYHVSASYSEALGWLVVSRIPAHLQNPRLREIVLVILLIVAGSVLVGLIIIPIWAQRIVRPIRSTAQRAHEVANGTELKDWPRSGIVELNQLSLDLQAMSDAISYREDELHRLNENLESRVKKRTQELLGTNQKLEQALATVEHAKDELIQSEKMAALGRLVAGVAHELNTPLGNGRMAVSALALKLAHFEESLESGLLRSNLTAFLKAVGKSTEIAEQNLLRASELIGSFKEVAADRTASRRRKFALKEIVDEVLLTLTPMLKSQPIKIKTEIPDNLAFDSYPGELGQVLTNLIVNAATHAFKEQGGTLTITAERQAEGFAVIRVQDDGAGMTEHNTKRAFDPFFTTAMGQGGTGLGLFVTFNAIANVLEGSISLESKEGEGSLFTIRIPLVASREKLSGATG